MNDPLRRALEHGLDALAVTADARQVERLLGFVRLLTRWNKAYNLTAIRTAEEMIDRHLIDSLSVLEYLERSPLLDIGTGPGLPGIPLAIMRPGWQFHLLDSNGKKIRFVRQAVIELGLTNVRPMQQRVEDCPLRGCGAVTARAFAGLDVLWRVARPLLQEGGCLYALKGRPEAAVSMAEGKAPACLQWHRLELPGERDKERHLAILCK